ncbi:MAG TPA: SGNH/GDSL hydrolase family protein [Nitrospira sp.]|nr:SGNH/GDSL hydrolase family protein [Nitrospira sp.]
MTEMANIIVGKLWLYRLISHAYNHAWPKSKVGPVEAVLQEGTGWRQSMAALLELVDMCRAHKILLVVFFERMDQNHDNLLLEDVVRHAEGVPAHDMASWFEGFDESLLENSKIDRHPNAEGHRVMAEHMANDIVRCLVMTSPTAILASHK